MLTEHIIYSSATAILVGMISLKFTGRDSSWIIILCSWIPDLLEKAHTVSHNVAYMVIFSILFASFLCFFGIKFFDALIFSLIGYAAHLFEDALVYETGYRFLWPFSNDKMGLGLLSSVDAIGSYVLDFFRIANTHVLITGLVFLLFAAGIRTCIEGPAWVRWYMPEILYLKLSRKIMEQMSRYSK